MKLPPYVLSQGDQSYLIRASMIIIIPAVILIKAWREAERKAAGAE